MKLVVGGAFQGKTDWTKRQYDICEQDIADGAICDDEAIIKAKAVNHFHLLVKRWLEDGREPMEAMEKLVQQKTDLIVITDEIGGGIVPLDRDERRYREVHGRMCCRLAGEADEVVRVICGIGQQLKHETLNERKGGSK